MIDIAGRRRRRRRRRRKKENGNDARSAQSKQINMLQAKLQTISDEFREQKESFERIVKYRITFRSLGVSVRFRLEGGRYNVVGTRSVMDTLQVSQRKSNKQQVFHQIDVNLCKINTKNRSTTQFKSAIFIPSSSDSGKGVFWPTSICLVLFLQNIYCHQISSERRTENGNY